MVIRISLSPEKLVGTLAAMVAHESHLGNVG